MHLGVSSRFWFALIVSLGLATGASGQQIPVFVFAGQSNMVGYATDSNQLTLAQQLLLSQQPTHRLWAGQQSGPVSWISMPNATQVNSPDPSGSDPRTFLNASGHGFGPELAAALTISNAQASKTVGAVKYAVNSTGLRVDGDIDWNTSSGELYTDMVTRSNAAKNALPTSQISAFFWMQGERDSTDPDRADVYQANLINLINTVRGAGPNGFGNTNLPIILGEIEAHPDFGQYTDTVRRAQANVAKLLTNVTLVRTDDLQHADNSVPFGNQHLSTQGTYDLGVRMGVAYLRSLNPLPSGPSSMNLAANGNFEDYAVSSWMGVGGSFSSGVTTSLTTMPGWTGINKGVTLVREGAFGGGTALASSGKQFLSLENGAFNPGGTGGASQTFATNNSSNSILRHYNVFFDYSAIARGLNETSQFTYDLSSGTQSVNTTTLSVNTNGVGDLQLAPWQSASFTFNSGGAATTLRFLPRDTPDGTFYGAAIDNVKVINGPVWTGGGGANTNWDNNSNWSNNNNPNDAGREGYKANFLWTAGSTTINLNQGRSIHSLRFDSPNSYTIGGGGNTLDMRSNNVGNTSILVVRGGHSINVRVNMNDVPMDVDVANGSTLTLNGQLSSNGSGRTVTKFGAGSLLLGHANNDYTGATRVVGGTLRLVNGTTTNNINTSPSITVYRDATLDTAGLSGGGITLAANQDLIGGGTVRGGVNATASGVNVVPGNSAGIMTFTGTGNITLGTNTVLDMEIGGAIDSTGTAGLSFDQIVIDGAGKSFVTGNARLNLIFLPGRAHAQPYTIVSAINGATINFTQLLKNLSGTLNEGIPVIEGGVRYYLNYDAHAITVTFTPEPSALAIAMLGMAGLLRRGRR